jgi:hypothetical protein
MVGHASQPRDQGPRGEMSGEVLVGKTVHGLHGGDGTAAIGGHAGPCVTADVLQARHGLAGGSGAGIHAGLPLGRLCPVRGTQALLLGVARAIEGVFLAGGCLHVRLLIGVLRAGTFLICKDRKDISHPIPQTGPEDSH